MVGAMARETSDAVIAYNVTMIIIITLLLTPVTGRRAREPKFTYSYHTRHASYIFCIHFRDSYYYAL